MIKAFANQPWAGGLFDTALGVVHDPCDRAEIDDDLRDRVRAQQFRTIASMTPSVMIGKGAVALSFAIVLHQSDALTFGPALWVAVAVLFSLHGLILWALRRNRALPDKVGRARRDRFVMRTLLLAVLWTVPGAVFLPMVPDDARSFLIAMIAGMMAGGAVALYVLPAAAMLYAGTLGLGGMIGYAQIGLGSSLAYVIVTVAFFAVIARAIVNHSQLFVSEFAGRMELDRKTALVERLLHSVEREAKEERRRSEVRLAQAQKMEAIGQLTGGIAHDFNNLLATVQGNAELLALEARGDRTLIAPILDASRRGADLVQRLLSFARKQILRPRDLSVETHVGGMLALLRRTLGTEIRIDTRIEPDVWVVHVDPGQLEAALLNLSLNAREALPDGGRLTITAANVSAAKDPVLATLGVTAGPFVRISVTDNGQGMSHHTIERAVDPFFTTKSVGQGSGLGLSMVYGFVRQSGGHFHIDSTLGRGTTVTIFLPRATLRAVSDDDFGAPMPLGNLEVILVVEDDPSVRRMVGDMLASLNYRTAFAETVAAAREVTATDSRLDLVLTDLMLPGGASGLDLAEQLEAHRPGLPVLFMSGFAGKPAASATGACPKRRLLQKPFDRAQLARFVQSALR